MSVFDPDAQDQCAREPLRRVVQRDRFLACADLDEGAVDGDLAGQDLRHEVLRGRVGGLDLFPESAKPGLRRSTCRTTGWGVYIINTVAVVVRADRHLHCPIERIEHLRLAPAEFLNHRDSRAELTKIGALNEAEPRT
ncbi:hypothetical protein ACRBEV_04330 [Methylobacterium phyllosphaerae]